MKVQGQHRFRFGVGCAVALCLCAFMACVYAADAAPQAADATATAPDAKPAETPAAEDAGKEAPVGSKDWIRGRLTIGVDGAWSGSDSSLRFDQSLDFQVDPPKYPKLHLRGSLWMQEDAISDPSMTSALRDINNASQGDIQFRPLYLYFQADDLLSNSTLRLGRQRVIEGAAYNRIDGVYFKQRLGIWDYYVFGGLRATIYGNSDESWVGGGGFSVRPLHGTKLGVDFYYSEGDDKSLGLWRGGQSAGHDNLLALSLWQTITPNLTFFGRYAAYDGKNDDLRLNLTGYVPCIDLTYEVAFRSRLGFLSDRVGDLTGLYRVLGGLPKNDNYFVALHEPLGKKLVFSIEGEYQNVRSDPGLAQSPRDYVRFGAVLAADDLFRGFGGNVNVERWDVDGGEGSWTVGGEITKRWKSVRVAVGSDYQRYEDRIIVYSGNSKIPSQYDYTFRAESLPFYGRAVAGGNTLAVELHENIRSVYLRGKWKICKDQDLTARLMFEEDDSPESPYWRAVMEYALRF